MLSTTDIVLYSILVQCLSAKRLSFPAAAGYRNCRVHYDCPLYKLLIYINPPACNEHFLKQTKLEKTPKIARRISLFLQQQCIGFINEFRKAIVSDQLNTSNLAKRPPQKDRPLQPKQECCISHKSPLCKSHSQL